MNVKWLIYCRVSSKKQVNEWNWLSSQEKRCRDYAENVLWIEIEKIFHDEWVSGWVFERASIKKLFQHIDENKPTSYIVIFEDLNRLSRDIQVHSLLRSEFRKRWVELACPNFQFDETPEGWFKENISIVVAQYEKDKNKQRVIDRMKARVQQWFWVFREPIWYKYIEAPTWWKILVLDTPTSNIIKQALEKYAKWELINLPQLWQFLFKKWIQVSWMTDTGKITSKSALYRLVTNILYTWQLECKKFWVPLIKAQHKALISIETYNQIQERLKNSSVKQRLIDNNLTRRDISADFPLRWFLYCEQSQWLLSWWWVKWCRKKHPYYMFPRKSPLKWKSINRDKLHEEFYQYLQNITPKEDLIDCFKEILKQQIELKKKDNEKFTKQLKQKINEIEKKIEFFLSRISGTNSETIIQNYEKEIEKLESEKKQILRNINNTSKNVWTHIFNKLDTIKNSLQIWNKSNLENKKNLLKLIFPQGIAINQNRGVWTTSLSLIYEVFEVSKTSKDKMVELMRFELMS